MFKERQNNDDITQDSDDKEQTTQEMFDKLKNILDDKSDHITDFSEEECFSEN